MSIHLAVPRHLTVALLLLVAAVACGDGPSSPSFSERVALRIDPEAQIIEASDTVHLTAIATSMAGDSSIRPPLTWRSSDVTVATVSAAGVVRGLSPGSVRIVAFTPAGDSASAGVTVTVRIASLRLAGAVGDSQPVGLTIPIVVDAFDATGAQVGGHPVEITSSDSTIARAFGASVFVLGFGDATVTIRVGSATMTRTIRGRLRQYGVAGQWADVEASDQFVCALPAPEGVPHCWGTNFNRRLGYPEGSLVPRPVLDGVPLRTLSVGYSHSCGLAADSTAWCWGSSNHGVLGATQSLLAYGMLQDTTRRRWRAIETGGHGATFGIAADSVAYSWGHNDFLQLARDSTGSRVDRRDQGVAWEGRKVGSLSTDQFHSCMVADDGVAWCSGNNATGLGTYGLTRVRPVIGGQRFKAVATGWFHTCGLLQSGEAMCWGFGERGVLGSGITGGDYSQYTPTQVLGEQRFESISASSGQVCALTAAGRAWCWGDGLLAYSSRPVELAVPYTWRTLSSGDGVTCGITTDRRLLCWGSTIAQPF